MSTIWIHIDHIDNEDGMVWAVQIVEEDKYIVCHEVECFIPLHTAFRREKQQPRAYLVGKGKYRVFRKDGTVKVIIYD